LELLTENLELQATSEAVKALTATSGRGRARIWDTGASKGMDNISTALGTPVPGPKTQVSTGAGIVTTQKWFVERLPTGDSVHVGLENTDDTISAGQQNAEHGVETSWLSPSVVPANRPGTCILHKPAKRAACNDKGNHVIWYGKHEVLIPSIVANTPELCDD
jgi:hypothetical protein